MLLTKSDIAGRWSEQDVLALWASYDPENDEPVAFWTLPSGEQLCCDCASNFDAENGFTDDTSPLGEDEEFDPRIGCDHCSTVIAFD